MKIKKFEIFLEDNDNYDLVGKGDPIKYIDEMDSDRLDSALRNAQEAFWEVIADEFPEIKSGDFSPGDAFEFDQAIRNAVEAWYDGNLPSRED